MMTREEAIESVLEGFQRLISLGARATAAREYSPSPDPDSDDDVIAAGKSQVAELRSLRQRFEDLVFLGVTGEKYESAQLREWFDTPQPALDNRTPRQMGIKAS